MMENMILSITIGYGSFALLSVLLFDELAVGDTD